MFLLSKRFGTLAGVLLIASFVAGCTGGVGPMGPNGANGSNGSPSPDYYTKTVRFTEAFSGTSYPSWLLYQPGAQPMTLAQDTTAFVSPLGSGKFSSNLVLSNTTIYRSALVSTGTLCASFNIALPNGLTGPNNSRDICIGSAGSVVASVILDPAYPGEFRIRHSGTEYTAAIFNMGSTWNSVQMCVNLSTGEADYWLNGAQVGHGYINSEAISIPSAPATWFGVRARTNGTWTLNLDDVEVFSKS